MTDSPPPAVYDGAVETARWILRALVAVALVIPLFAVAGPVAHAQMPGLVDITITGNTSPVVDVSEPEQVVELTGTIINTSTSRIQYTAVNFWKSTDPIVSQSGLDEALASAANVPEGERQEPWDEESGHVQVITTQDWFEPGQRATFTVRATVGELEFPVDDASYLVGVHVRGIAEGVPGNNTVGRGRILVAATSSQLKYSEVIELSAGPHRSMDGDFVDDALSERLASDFDDLLTVAEETDSTVLLDPMLLMDARALGSEHTVAGEPAAPDEVAASWVTRVESLIARGDVLRLPYGDVDVPRADQAGLLTEVVAWADDAVTDPTLRALPLATTLDTSATPELVRQLGDLGFTFVLARNTTGGSIGPVQVIHISDVFEQGMGPGGNNTTAQQLGRRVAEEVVATTPPTYLVDTVAMARQVAVLPTRREPVPLKADDTASSFTAATSGPGWDELSATIQGLQNEAAFRLDLTGVDDVPQLERAAVIAMSSSFDTEAEALDWLGSGQITDVDPSKITISAASQFVMGSRTNDFPVTVNNGLGLPVTLRLVFDSESPQRIRVPATEFVTVDPGESLALTLSPEASSNSVVTVEGHMETTDGTRFGAPVSIEITATELGRVGWIIIIVSGAVVLGGTAWRIRAVQSERSKEDA